MTASTMMLTLLNVTFELALTSSTKVRCMSWMDFFRLVMVFSLPTTTKSPFDSLFLADLIGVKIREAE